jgi:hypothetical protein
VIVTLLQQTGENIKGVQLLILAGLVAFLVEVKKQVNLIHWKGIGVINKE